MNRRRVWLGAMFAFGSLAIAAAACSGRSEDECGSGSCPGCCNADGECVQGGALQMCGTGGRACIACSHTQLCTAGTCVTIISSNDAGSTDAGSDAGDDGGVDAGCVENAGACSVNEQCCSLFCDINQTCQSRPSDSCETALPLTFTGTTTRTAVGGGTTVGYVSDDTSSCGGSGPDRVFTFTTNTTQDIVASVNSGTTLQPVLYLKSGCPGTEVTCEAATAVGGSAQLNHNGLPAGVYYLWVDGADATSGDFNFSVTLTTPPLGENCTNAIPLDFSVSPTQTVTGSTADAGNDRQPSCTPAFPAPDRVYSFELPAARNVTATVTATSAWDVALVLAPSPCVSIAEVACRDLTNPPGSETVIANLGAGTWFLWVDGVTTADRGGYTLEVTVGP